MLKRLRDELLSIGDKEGELIPKGFKYKRPKGRKKVKIYRPGSHYIGVSRNGSKWQALLLFKSRKIYLGTLESEEETAMFYDRHSILTLALKR